MDKASNNYNRESIFPVRLRALMDENKVTQAELAQACGVQRQSVAQWRDGNTRPEILSLGKIAEFFNVSADYLIGLTDNKTTDKATLEVCATVGLNDHSIKFLLNPDNAYLRHGIDLLIQHHTDATPEDDKEPLHDVSILQSLTALMTMAESGEDAFINYGENTIEGKHGDTEDINLQMPKIKQIVYTNPDQRRTLSLFEAESLIEKNMIDCALSDIIFKAYTRNVVRRYHENNPTEAQEDETEAT